MPHRADNSFFDKKRPWSQQKDNILGYYLHPYLTKVSQLRKPILLVDGFAGPGKFLDGKLGSPLILCRQAETARQRGAEVSVLCIERDEELFRRLGTRKFDDFDPITGTGFEANTTPWSRMTQDQLSRKLDQVGSDLALLRENRVVKRIVWFGTEELPTSGLGNRLREALQQSGIEYWVVPWH